MTFLKQEARTVFVAVMTALLFFSAIGSSGFAGKTKNAKDYAVAVSAGPGLELRTEQDKMSMPAATTQGRQLVCARIVDLGVARVGLTCAAPTGGADKVRAAFAAARQ